MVLVPRAESSHGSHAQGHEGPVSIRAHSSLLPFRSPSSSSHQSKPLHPGLSWVLCTLEHQNHVFCFTLPFLNKHSLPILLEGRPRLTELKGLNGGLTGLETECRPFDTRYAWYAGNQGWRSSPRPKNHIPVSMALLSILLLQM